MQAIINTHDLQIQAQRKTEIPALIFMFVCFMGLLGVKKDFILKYFSSSSSVNEDLSPKLNKQVKSSTSGGMEQLGMYLHLKADPTASNVKINYRLFKDAGVELSVYNTKGKKVDILLNKHIKSGEYTYLWDKSSIEQGLYFVKLHGAGRQLVKRIEVI